MKDLLTSLYPHNLHHSLPGHATAHDITRFQHDLVTKPHS